MSCQFSPNSFVVKDFFTQAPLLVGNLKAVFIHGLYIFHHQLGLKPSPPPPPQVFPIGINVLVTHPLSLLVKFSIF